ncbi:MAG: hypothetical protein HZB62_10820 [Nitrospirae bacterium]|nr:hypothetical protein [Nitrospirota bacterium]
MALIKFERTSAPTGSVQFARNPGPGSYSRKTEYMQPKERSNGGDLYSYDKGISPDRFRTLSWKNISATDLANFMTFLGVVVGIKENFTFTDYDGATYTARIWNADDIQSAPVATGRESLTVVLRIES